MTYDEWKTTEPDYDDGELRGTCDVCERQHVPISRCWASGIETYACDECRGFGPERDPDEWRDQVRDDKMWDEQNK